MKENIKSKDFFNGNYLFIRTMKDKCAPLQLWVPPPPPPQINFGMHNHMVPLPKYRG